MATRTKAPAREMARDGHGRSLKTRGMPFLGLLVMPPGALVAGLAVHLAVRDSVVGLGLTAAGLGAASAVLALVAWAVGQHRDLSVTVHVVATVAATGLGEAVTVVVGLQRWWAYAFLLGGWLVAASWGIRRIDAFRKDHREEPEKEDSLRKELGLEGTRFGRPKHHVDEKGEVTRIEVPVKHAPGKTVDVIQQAVPGIESLANAPRGRSRAVPGEGAAASTLVIITKDVLKDLIPYPGPSAPGGCITDPLVSAMYEDQLPTRRYIAGGTPEAPNPSSTGRMGMTRTGKTLNAQVDALEVISRRNAQFMWFDTIKGAQTVRPLRQGLDIIVASDDPKTFRAGMKALIALVKWRTNRLGECGYRSWTAKVTDDPRLRMPFLIAHFEEADALCDIAPDEMVFLASKGLSVGVATSISLQRADATSMPTGLRFNIGNWSVFGCGDQYSAGFALSDATIDAGAHPENWKQSKPGYHYVEGIGIPEDRWPVAAKSFFATDAEMEAHTTQWAPQMMPLDEGSQVALGSWYAAAKAETLRLRLKWDADGQALPLVHDGAPGPAATSANTTLTRGGDSPAVLPDSDEDDEVADQRRARQQLIDDMEDDVASGAVDLGLDDDDPDDRGMGDIDITKPVPQPTGDDGLSWADEKIPPTDRAAALAAFERALREMAEDESLRDQANPDVAVFNVDALARRYKFRSRPWFSEILSDAAEGALTLPGLSLTRTDKPGFYRLERLADVVPIGNSA
ncbi:hypothetical protein [Rhizomonospora bruguierae]|uniref:hypothetical protein n=1 Tax=Rhizomonospora bruguierae TaxID=1581705 RepID=UPI001BCB58FE|nr:hypothetical protein [Micromonospora sp. NBRC 107566]